MLKNALAWFIYFICEIYGSCNTKIVAGFNIKFQIILEVSDGKDNML